MVYNVFPFFPFLKACFICKESVLSFKTTFLFIYFITLNVSYILRQLCFCIFLMCCGRLLTSCHTSAHCCSRGNSAGPRGSVWPGVWRLVTVAGILWFLVNPHFKMERLYTVCMHTQISTLEIRCIVSLTTYVTCHPVSTWAKRAKEPSLHKETTQGGCLPP